MVMQQRDAEAVPQAMFTLFVWPATPRPVSTVGAKPRRARHPTLRLLFFTVSFYTIVLYYVHFFALSVGNMDI